MKSCFSHKMNRQKGFLALPNDNIFKTIAVATLLCLVCSLIVSSAATLLKPRQVANKLVDKKSNILAVAGIDDPDKSIDELFESIEPKVVDLETGEYTDTVDANEFDQRKAAKEQEYRLDLTKEQDLAQVGAISKFGNVYLSRKNGQVDKIILPISGYGLWSTLYGFIALESDATTVSGITFYEHAETPGLGGEIENQRWRAIWDGKKITDASGQPVIQVIKGPVTSATPNAEHKIDGLAGATLTSNGVTNLVQFWMGEHGFGRYLQRIRSGEMSVYHNNEQLSNSQTLVVTGSN